MKRVVCVVMLWAGWSSMLSPSLHGEPWPRFRGPNGSGISQPAAIPTTWTARDYRWQVELPGIGWSSPVVSGDRLFVTSADDEDAKQTLRCLRASDGGTIWQREFASATHPMHRFNCYASATPVLDDERVYMSWANPGQHVVVALDQDRGNEIWRRDLGPFASEHGFGASAMLFGDLLVVPRDQDTDSSVVALDRRTGRTRWQRRRNDDRAAFATPCIYQPEGGRAQLILSSSAHGITSLDPATGEVHWELPLFQNRVVGSPLVAAGLIFASAGTGGIGRQMYAIRPGDPDRGTEAEVAYEIQGSLPYVPIPVAHDDLIFLWFDKGVVTCLEAATGALVWRERVGGDYFGSPVRVGDRLYCISRTGEVVVLAASREFKELGRVDLGEPSNSTPAVADGVMYLRTASHLMAIGG